MNLHLHDCWYYIDATLTYQERILLVYISLVNPLRYPSLFPCKSTSFSPQLSHFLSVSHVEHHISLKKLPPSFKTIQRKCVHMHYARKNSQGKNGNRHF